MPSYRERSSRPFRLILLLALAAALIVLARPIAFGALRVASFVRAPKLTSVPPLVLQRWLTDADLNHPVLVDARGRAEVRVSMIPGARRIDPDDPHPAESLRLQPNTAVVVYSGLSWRALGVAERIEAVGMGPVMVLQGGIFRWANEGRPLETPARAHTGLVHPWALPVGLLLEREHRASP
jgi:rhodanese-related sulfurtransferase